MGKDLNTFENIILEEIDKSMDDFIDRVFEISQDKLVEENKIDTGTMFKTANVNRAFLEKIITYPAPYSDIVHFGRNPGQYVPIDPLTKWVQRKLKISNFKKARSIAFAISASIKKKGINPFPFLQHALDETLVEQGLV